MELSIRQGMMEWWFILTFVIPSAFFLARGYA